MMGRRSQPSGRGCTRDRRQLRSSQHSDFSSARTLRRAWGRGAVVSSHAIAGRGQSPSSLDAPSAGVNSASGSDAVWRGPSFTGRQVHQISSLGEPVCFSAKVNCRAASVARPFSQFTDCGAHPSSWGDRKAGVVLERAARTYLALEGAGHSFQLVSGRKAEAHEGIIPRQSGLQWQFRLKPCSERPRQLIHDCADHIADRLPSFLVHDTQPGYTGAATRTVRGGSRVIRVGAKADVLGPSNSGGGDA